MLGKTRSQEQGVRSNKQHHESEAESRHARLRVATSWEEVAIGKNVRDVSTRSQRGAHLMDGGKGKSHDFRLSQALANQVVRKGGCGDFILCGLSPPVSTDWSLVHRYTFLTAHS